MADMPTEDMLRMVPVYADRADKCLIEAQAAVLEGNLPNSHQLVVLAEAWSGLIALLTGQVGDDCCGSCGYEADSEP